MRPANASIFDHHATEPNEEHSIPSSPTSVPLLLSEVELSRNHRYRRLVSTKELSEMWGIPESTLRYWRGAEIGPPYVKLGGRIKYDLVDVEHYVRVHKRMPSVRAHGG